jgi:3-hydroxyisobutyrate dehydrogenase-like beta-hydroxyacid dehydrogenase
MIQRDFRPGGTIGILSKDLGYARSLARELNIPIPVTAAADEVFTAARASGKTNLSQPSIIQMWEKLLDIDVVAGKLN